jgi:hypothetical protein
MDQPIYPNPLPFITSYPAAAAILLIVLSTMALLWVATRIDRTGGSLVISLIIVVAFIGVVAYCLVFSVPKDEINSTVIGGLATAFGAVIMFWLNRNHDRKDPPPKQDDKPDVSYKGKSPEDPP